MKAKDDAAFIPDIGALINDERLKPFVEVLRPYIPAIQREGVMFYNDVLKYCITGEWDQLTAEAWKVMTEDERDAASTQLLQEARDAVDRNFEREKMAREIIFKLALSVLTSFL